MSNKITWVSILQGWSMLLVVIGHIMLTNIFQNEATPVTAFIEKNIYSFHMPLFMFISGFLFYHTKLEKNKDYITTIKDKSKRLLIPFCFFTIACLLLKYAFNPLMKRPVELSFNYIINSFLYPASNPLGELWFISTLFILFLFMPVYKYALANKIRTGICWIICLSVFVFFPDNIDLLCISRVGYYAIYFFSGILFFKFAYYKYLENKTVFFVSALLFFTLTILSVPKISLSFSGILFSICLCLQLAKYIPTLFGSFRDYTFQIFLLGIFFQMAVRFAYLKVNIESLYILFYIGSILVALYIPTFMAIQIKKIKVPIIRLFFGL